VRVMLEPVATVVADAFSDVELELVPVRLSESSELPPQPGNESIQNVNARVIVAYMLKHNRRFMMIPSFSVFFQPPFFVTRHFFLQFSFSDS